MDRSPRTAAIVVLALLLLSAATLMAGCTQQQPLTVKLADHPTYGKILTDSTGRSLYILARDVPNTGAVANLGDVGRFYPPFYAESVASGNGINISEFGHITRADGKQQTTFRGWPLYYYINDKTPGDAKSQGANNITFLAKPDYTVMVRENVTQGVYLSDPAGAALLARANDTGPAVSTPGYVPFRASPLVGPSPLVQAADFGEATGPSGEVQTTFRGQLLYVSSDKVRPGAIPQNTSGYHTVILAPGGTLTGPAEAPTAAPSPSPTTAEASTAATTVPVTTTEATASTGSRDGSYTGGEYTPTPFQTVEVISQSTESATPASTWTPVSTGEATPLPTVSLIPTTLVPATPTVPVTNRTTAARTTTVPTTKTPTTSHTTPPTSIPSTKATTVPVTTVPTTTVPSTKTPTTLPLPFPITTLPPNPAASTQSGNGS